MRCIKRKLGRKPGRKVIRWADARPTPAHWQLVVDNRGLIGMMIEKRARNIDKGSQQWEDLFSFLLTALMRAAMSFKPKLGFKFSTYATRCIYYATIQYRKTRQAIKSARTQQFSQLKSDDQSPFESLDERQAERWRLKRAMNTVERVAIEELDARQIDILGRLFGRFGYPTGTNMNGGAENLDDVARHYGKSRQRIEQIQKGALAKLRTALEERGMTAESFAA